MSKPHVMPKKNLAIHSVCVLRRLIGFYQKNFADEICDRSVRTVQELEAGRLKLSEDLAQKISVETGVDLGWLLENNPDIQPIARDGTLYTIEVFNQHREKLGGQRVRIGGIEDFYGVTSLFSELLGAVAIAAKKHRGERAMYRLKKAAKELVQTFGKDEETAEQFSGVLDAALRIRDVFRGPDNQDMRREYDKQRKQCHESLTKGSGKLRALAIRKAHLIDDIGFVAGILKSEENEDVSEKVASVRPAPYQESRVKRAVVAQQLTKTELRRGQRLEMRRAVLRALAKADRPNGQLKRGH